MIRKSLWLLYGNSKYRPECATMKCWVFLCIFIAGKVHSALAGTSDLRKKHQKMLSESNQSPNILCSALKHTTFLEAFLSCELQQLEKFRTLLLPSWACKTCADKNWVQTQREGRSRARREQVEVQQRQLWDKMG